MAFFKLKRQKLLKKLRARQETSTSERKASRAVKRHSPLSTALNKLMASIVPQSPTRVELPRGILDLPAELKTNIVQQLDKADSTCLGLSCKPFYIIHRKRHGLVPLGSASSNLKQFIPYTRLLTWSLPKVPVLLWSITDQQGGSASYHIVFVDEIPPKDQSLFNTPFPVTGRDKEEGWFHHVGEGTWILIPLKEPATFSYRSSLLKLHWTLLDALQDLRTSFTSPRIISRLKDLKFPEYCELTNPYCYI